jgi:hypothetical protein
MASDATRGKVREAGGTLPAARLQPLPFLEPHRLLDLLEEDLSVIEAGLRVAARDVPIPSAGVDLRADALCTDSSRRVVVMTVAERLDAATLGRAIEARSWIETSLPALRALSPALQGDARDVRCVVLTSRIEPSATSLLSRIAEPRPTVYEISFFESPTGIAIDVRSASSGASSRERHRPERRGEREHGETSVPVEGGGDPLAGIPLTAAEAAEFRRMADARAARSPIPSDPRPSQPARPAPASGMRHPSAAAPLAPGWPIAFVEN